MTELKRITTQYDPVEDRIRVTGTGDDGRTLTLWLTQRLLNRLAAHLCQGLENKAAKPARSPEQPLRTHVEQAFAQQRAKAEQGRLPPVVPSTDTPQWRVDNVDVKLGKGGARLTFKGAGDSQQALLTLAQPALRQWLGIVYEQYRRSGWPLQAWPAWMEEAATATPASPPAGALH